MSNNSVEMRTSVTGEASGFESMMKGMEAAMSSMQKSVDKLNASVAKIGKTKSVGTVAGVDKQTQSVKKASDGLNQYVKQASLARQHGSLLANAFNSNSRVIDSKYLSSLTGLRNALYRVGKEFQTTSTFHNGYVKTLADADLAHARFMIKGNLITRTLDNMSTKMINLGKNAQWTGRQLMVGITAPLVGLAAVAVKSAMDIGDIDLTLQRVLATASKGDFKKLDDQTKSLSETFGVTRKSLKEMQSEFARVGFSVDQIIKATQQSSELSILGKVDTAQAQKLVQILYQTGSAYEEVQDQIQKFLLMDQKTNMNIKDTTAALADVYPTAKRLNMTMAQTAAFMAGITQGGIDASDAARVLNYALNKTSTALANIFNKDTGGKSRLKNLQEQLKGAQALTGQGVSLFDEFGKQKSGSAILTDLSGLWDKLTKLQTQKADALKQQMLSALFGTDNSTQGAQFFDAMSKSMDTTTAQGQDLAKAMDIANQEVGHFAEEWTKQLGVVAGSEVVQIQGQIQKIVTAGQEIGKKLLPYVIKLLTFINGLIDKFMKLGEGTQKWIIGMLAGLAAIGPMIYVVAQGVIAMGSIFKGLVAPVKSFFKIGQTVADEWEDAFKKIHDQQILLGESFAKGKINVQEFNRANKELIESALNTKDVTEGVAAATEAQAASTNAAATATERQVVAQNQLNAAEAVGVSLAGKSSAAAAAKTTRATVESLVPDARTITSTQTAKDLVLSKLAQEQLAKQSLRTMPVKILKQDASKDRVGELEKVIKMANGDILGLSDPGELDAMARALAKDRVADVDLAPLRERTEVINHIKAKLNRFKRIWGNDAPISIDSNIKDPMEALHDLNIRFDAFNDSLNTSVRGIAGNMGKDLSKDFFDPKAMDPTDISRLWREALIDAGLKKDTRFQGGEGMPARGTLQHAAKDIVDFRNAKMAETGSQPILTASMLELWKEEMFDSSGQFKMHTETLVGKGVGRNEGGEVKKVTLQIQEALQKVRDAKPDVSKIGKDPVAGLTSEMRGVTNSIRPKFRSDEETAKWKKFGKEFEKLHATASDRNLEGLDVIEQLLADASISGDSRVYLEGQKARLIKSIERMEVSASKIAKDITGGVVPNLNDTQTVMSEDRIASLIRKSIGTTTKGQNVKARTSLTEKYLKEIEKIDKASNWKNIKPATKASLETRKARLLDSIERMSIEGEDLSTAEARSFLYDLDRKARGSLRSDSGTKFEDLIKKEMPAVQGYAYGFKSKTRGSTQTDHSAIGHVPADESGLVATNMSNAVNDVLFKDDMLGTRSALTRGGEEELKKAFDPLVNKLDTAMLYKLEYEGAFQTAPQLLEDRLTELSDKYVMDWSDAPEHLRPQARAFNDRIGLHNKAVHEKREKAQEELNKKTLIDFVNGVFGNEENMTGAVHAAGGLPPEIMEAVSRSVYGAYPESYSMKALSEILDKAEADKAAYIVNKLSQELVQTVPKVDQSHVLKFKTQADRAAGRLGKTALRTESITDDSLTGSGLIQQEAAKVLDKKVKEIKELDGEISALEKKVQAAMFKPNEDLIRKLEELRVLGNSASELEAKVAEAEANVFTSGPWAGKVREPAKVKNLKRQLASARGLIDDHEDETGMYLSDEIAKLTRDIDTNLVPRNDGNTLGPYLKKKLDEKKSSRSKISDELRDASQLAIGKDFDFAGFNPNAATETHRDSIRDARRVMGETHELVKKNTFKLKELDAEWDEMFGDFEYYDIYMSELDQKIVKAQALSDRTRRGIEARPETSVSKKPRLEAIDRNLAALKAEQMALRTRQSLGPEHRDSLKAALRGSTRRAERKGNVAKEFVEKFAGGRGEFFEDDMSALAFAHQGAGNLTALNGNLSPGMAQALHNIVLNRATEGVQATIKGKSHVVGDAMADARLVIKKYMPELSDEMNEEFAKLAYSVAGDLNNNLDQASFIFGEDLPKQIRDRAHKKGMKTLGDEDRANTFDTHTGKESESSSKREIPYEPGAQEFMGREYTPEGEENIDDMLSKYARGEISSMTDEQVTAAETYKDVKAKLEKAIAEEAAANASHSVELQDLTRMRRVGLEKQLYDSMSVLSGRHAIGDLGASKKRQIDAENVYKRIEAQLEQAQIDEANLGKSHNKKLKHQAMLRKRALKAQLEQAMVDREAAAKELASMFEDGIEVTHDDGYRAVYRSQDEMDADSLRRAREKAEKAIDPGPKPERAPLPRKTKKNEAERERIIADHKADLAKWEADTKAAQDLMNAAEIERAAIMAARQEAEAIKVNKIRDTITAAADKNAAELERKSLLRRFMGLKGQRALTKAERDKLAALHASDILGDVDSALDGSFTPKTYSIKELRRLRDPSFIGPVLPKAGRVARLGAAADRAAESFGSAAPKVGKKLASAVNMAVNPARQAQGVFHLFYGKVATEGEDVGKRVGGLTKNLKAMFSVVKDEGGKVVGMGKGRGLLTGLFGEGMGGGVSTGLAGVAPILPILIAVAAIIAVLWMTSKKWIDYARPGIDKLKESLKALWHAAVDPLIGAFRRMGGEGGKSGSAWKSIGEIIGKVCKGIAAGIKFIIPIVTIVFDILSNLVYMVLQGFRLIVSLINGDWAEAWDAAKEIFKTWWEGIKEIAAGAIKLIINGLVWLVKAGIDLMFLLAEKGLQLAKKLHAPGADALLGEVESFKNGIKDAIDKVGDFAIDKIIFWDSSNSNREAYKKGKETGDVVVKGANDGITGESLTAPIVSADDQLKAAEESTKTFISAFKSQMDKIVDGWKKAALDAFDTFADAQKQAIDDKVKAIDDEIDAERKRDEDLDYFRKKDDMRAAKQAAGIKYRANRNLAIATGRYDDAAQLDYDYNQEMQGMKKDEVQLEEDRAKTLVQRQRDAQKQALADEKEALTKSLEQKKSALEAELEAITEYTPKNVAEAESMQQQVLAAMGKYTEGYGKIGTKMGEAWNSNWSTAMDKAKKQVAEDAFWAGSDALNAFALGLGLDADAAKLASQAGVDAATAQQVLELSPSYQPTRTHVSQPKVITGTVNSEFPTEQLVRHSGGDVPGAGEVDATLLSGEYVMQRSAVNKYGTAFMDQLNEGKKPKYHSGGLITAAFSNQVQKFAKKFSDGAQNLRMGSGDSATFVTADSIKQKLAPSVTDAIPTGVIDGLNEAFRAQFNKWDTFVGGKYDVYSGYRSYAEQAELYRKYLAGTGNLAAPPGQSYHEFGLAIDTRPSATAEDRAAANKFGLEFPIQSEPWHVQPINASAIKAAMLAGSMAQFHKGGMVFPAIPSLDVGGMIRKSGIAEVHRNERVLTAAETAAYHNSNSVGGATEINLHFDGGYFGTDRELEKLVNRIDKEITPKINRVRGTQSRTFTKVTR